MRRLTVISLVAAGVSVAITAATAADISPAPVYAKAPVAAAPFSWSGFYVGAQGGAGWGTTTDNLLSENGDPSPMTTTFQDQINGWHGGFTAGYNWQFNQLVLGVEGDWSLADISGKSDCSAFSSIFVLRSNCSLSSKLGNFATIDGRLGFAVDHALVYVKGGAAYGHFTHDDSAGLFGGALPLGLFALSATDNRWGGTAGVGIEYAFARNWSAKLEYDYLDFGTRTVTLNGSFNFGGANLSTIDSIREQVSVVRAGVNYRFDWGQ
jgi:outer membrane immunogenic protein